VQQHVNDSSFFDRSWNEFRYPFGVQTGNFWLGNELIHGLTRDGHCRLRFDLHFDGGDFDWAQYTTFFVANEADNYRVTVSGYSGEFQTAHHAACARQGI